MTFLIHYLAKTPVKDLAFDIVSHSPVSAASLASLRVSLARDASLKTGRDFTPDDIVIANVIPMPDADPQAKQIGGA